MNMIIFPRFRHSLLGLLCPTLCGELWSEVPWHGRRFWVMCDIPCQL